MNDNKCIVRQIRDYSQNKGEVYALINVIEKKVYVGETGDGECRELTHAKCIFGLEKSSNNNLIAENQDNKYCLMYLYSFSGEDKKNNHDDNSWIAMETVYMYLFVKHGFQLYNTNKGKDNLGKEREFLIKGLDSEELYEKVIKFLISYPVVTELKDEDSTEEFSIDSWEKVLEIAEQVFLKDIYNVFKYTISEIVRCQDSNKLWEDFVESKKDDKDFIILTQMKYEQDFFRFNKKKLEGLEVNLNIESISLKTLLKDEKLEYIIYTKVGDYLGETVYQILQNKFEDLNRHICLEISENDVSACFWSLSGKQEEWIRKEIIEKDIKEMYMILAYTGSKSLSDNLAEESTAKHYAFNRKKKTIKYDYPQEFNAERIVPYNKSMAFLISDFYYVEEDVSGCIIEEAYTAIYENGVKDKKIENGAKQKPFFLAEIKEEDKNILISKIDKVDVDSNITGLLIAKLVYPFVVAVEMD